MKWICWICGRENPFRPLKAVQDKCPKCGDELRTGRAPLATTTNIAGFLLMIGGVFWDRVTKQAAMASHLAGIGCAIIWVATGLVDVLSPTYPVAVVTWGVGIIATLMSKPAAAPAQKE